MSLRDILLIVFSILIAAFVVIFLVVFKVRTKKIQTNDNSIFFMQMDLKNLRIKKNNLQLDYFFNKSNNFSNYFKNLFPNGWMTFRQFFSIIGIKEEEKWKRAIEFSIQNKTNTTIYSEFKFKNKNNKRFIYFLGIKFIYVDENTLNIDLFLQIPVEHDFYENRIISKSKLFNLDHKYKLFIAFSIENTTSSFFIQFINQLNKLIKIKNSYFFKSSKMIVMVLSNNSYSKLQKYRLKIQNKLESKKAKANLEAYYNALAFVECQDLKTESDFSKVMTRISFALIKSKSLRVPIHFNLQNIKFNEFEEFKEKIMIIDGLIKSNNFDYEILPVKSIKSMKEIFQLVAPTFEFENNYNNEAIFKINEFDKKIRERFVESILRSNKQFGKKILININDYQIETIFDLMKENKNFIYIVHRVKYREIGNFENLLKLLELSEINYALYVEEFDSEVLSLLTNLDVKMIVLSMTFNNNFEESMSTSKLEAVNAIILAENRNITLIFTEVEDKLKKELELLTKKDKLYVPKSSQNLI